MTKKQINQNDILDVQLLNLLDYSYLYNNNPINRIKAKLKLENVKSKLELLKIKIKNVKDCNLKINASKIVFSEGNIHSPLMIVGDGPGKNEDKNGKPFQGDSGILLNKMLNAIKIKRGNVYLTNVLNYRPLNDRKPEKSEVTRYSEFLKEHISIINPKIIILMGATAMMALLGNNSKISNIRGQWKDIIIKQKSFKTIVTFHPDYLLKLPDQKIFSWEDLKIIRKEIDKKNIII